MHFSPQVSLIPALVKGFLDIHKLIKVISCGSYHNAVITQENELYTWGSNQHGCLGRKLHEDNTMTATILKFSPHPGYVGGFGAIVNRIGRGLVKSVSCGKHFTIVITLPYAGPNEEMAQKLMDEEERKKKKKEMQIKVAQHHRNSLIGVEDYTMTTKSENGKTLDG